MTSGDLMTFRNNELKMLNELEEPRLSKTKVKFTIREIEEGDFQKGFFETLSNLSSLEGISEDLPKARKILKQIKQNPFHKIFVAVKDDGEVIGTMTIFIEQKFIHDGGLVGHTEDLVAKKGYEGLGIARALVCKCLEFSKANNCYKMICNCTEQNVGFWEKVGHRRHEVGMRCDLI